MVISSGAVWVGDYMDPSKKLMGYTANLKRLFVINHGALHWVAFWEGSVPDPHVPLIAKGILSRDNRN